MNQLEIIHLRLAAELPDDILHSIRTATDTMDESWRVKIYKQHGEMADISVLIRRDNSSETRSYLGEHIAQELKQYGVVEYSYWAEI